jgi:hypothetical protein
MIWMDDLSLSAMWHVVRADLQNMTFASATWGDRVGQTLALCLNGSTMAIGAPNTTTRAGVKKDGCVIISG